MQAIETNPNHTIQSTFSHKDILVKKLVCAVAACIFSQLIILVSYIFIANLSIFHPIERLASVASTFTHLSTWIFVIIFSLVVFAQCLICAKDYVLMSSYCSTRFKQLLHIFSVHNFTLLFLYILIGGAFVWQLLWVVESKYSNIVINCKGKHYCLVEDTFFLIVGGLWSGFYFFLKIYVSSKHLIFPVIQQNKILQFRANIASLFKKSMSVAVWSTVQYAICYYILGNQLESRFMYFFALERSFHESSILIYLYCWWLTTLYIFSMNLMRFFFFLYLTETIEFPLVKANSYILTLQEALVMNNLPVIQNLACLDLFVLSQWSPLRRQIFFTLSQPGGHPHNWNALTENVLRLFAEYTDLLKKSADNTTTQQEKAKIEEIKSPFSHIRLQSPANSKLKYRNLRNMTCSGEYPEVVNVSQNITTDNVFLEALQKTVNDRIEKIVSFLKICLGINFFFGYLPQVNIQKCLGNGQLIIWASQGISEIVRASLTEDKYGIIQKDLPIIINSLVELKQNLDKLSQVPALSRKVAGLDDFNYKMKNSVNAAVKRSLFNICLHFGEYFNEICISKEALQYLQANVMVKTCD